jgi:transcriptional antiterminator RfaH
MSTTRAEKWGKFPQGYPAWYCIRTQPKRENIASATLEREFGFEVFLPRLRFKRSTQRGTVWFNEPLFPSYFFAKFDFFSYKRAVNFANGVAGIVHFGEFYPQIPEDTIVELRRIVGPEQIHIIEDEFCEGDEVVVGDGPFKGLEVVVIKPMPGSKRVAVLMEFLGRQTVVEMEKSALLKTKQEYVVNVFQRQ